MVALLRVEIAMLVVGVTCVVEKIGRVRLGVEIDAEIVIAVVFASLRI